MYGSKFLAQPSDSSRNPIFTHPPTSQNPGGVCLIPGPGKSGTLGGYHGWIPILLLANYFQITRIAKHWNYQAVTGWADGDDTMPQSGPAAFGRTGSGENVMASPAAKLCGFILLLALVFAAAYAAGARLGPVTTGQTQPGNGGSMRM